MMWAPRQHTQRAAADTSSARRRAKRIGGKCIRRQPQPQNIKIPPLSLSYIITHKGLKIEGDLSSKIRDIAYDQALEFWAMPVTGSKPGSFKHTPQEAGQKATIKQALPTQGAVAHLRRHNKIGKAIIGPSREAFACTNYTSRSHTRLSYMISNRRQAFCTQMVSKGFTRKHLTDGAACLGEICPLCE